MVYVFLLTPMVAHQASGMIVLLKPVNHQLSLPVLPATGGTTLTANAPISPREVQRGAVVAHILPKQVVRQFLVAVGQITLAEEMLLPRVGLVQLVSTGTLKITVCQLQLPALLVRYGMYHQAVVLAIVVQVLLPLHLVQ